MKKKCGGSAILVPGFINETKKHVCPVIDCKAKILTMRDEIRQAGNSSPLSSKMIVDAIMVNQDQGKFFNKLNNF